jgi:polynucleotide 5'-kinase involved in rRNA processing
LPEALEELEKLGNEPVAVVSICGPKGIGKSYIANVLVSRFQGKGVSIT